MTFISGLGKYDILPRLINPSIHIINIQSLTFVEVNIRIDRSKIYDITEAEAEVNVIYLGMIDPH